MATTEEGGSVYALTAVDVVTLVALAYLARLAIRRLRERTAAPAPRAKKQ